MNFLQIKAARAILDWSQDDLAREAGVSIQTVKRAEASQTFGVVPVGSDMIAKIKEAFDRAGVEVSSELRPDGSGSIGITRHVQDQQFTMYELYGDMVDAVSALKRVESKETSKDRRAVITGMRENAELMADTYLKRASGDRYAVGGEPSPEDARKMVGLSVGIGRLGKRKPTSDQ